MRWGSLVGRDRLVPVAVAIALAATWATGCKNQNQEVSGRGPRTRDEKTRFVRASALAGSWYPDDERVLSDEVARFLKEASQGREKDGAALPEGRLVALVSPHAGYRYSGGVMAYGYSLLKAGAYSRVIVLGPSHHSDFRGISTPDETHYTTPLGYVQIDREAVERLRGDSLFTREPAAEAVEHSIEIELPFLQLTLGEFKLVPLLVGALTPSRYGEVAERIRTIVDDRTLIVASSDFTHYGPNYGYVPFPAGESVARKLEELDLGAVRLIRELDAAGFDEYRGRTGATICGARPIDILIALLPRGSKSVMLKYDTSGRMLGDYTNSVSYVSLAFFGPSSDAELDPSASPARPPQADVPRSSAAPPAPQQQSATGDLTQAELATALSLARASLVNHLAREPVAEEAVLSRFTLTDRLKTRAGAFVTLKKNGELRGCIGTIEPVLPLYQTIYQNAIHAASNDPRFPPVTPDELPAITLEVSVLSPLHPIGGPDELDVGRQGVLMKKGASQAVFLPQVATEQGWGREETLSQLSRKAGLAADAWKEGARFWVFTAQVLVEKQKGGDA